MKREEEIMQEANTRYSVSHPFIDIAKESFIEGAKWADENPDKNLVYTKQELLNMGFGFDLNGNISTPQEIEERSKKYINHRKSKRIEKACEWLEEKNKTCMYELEMILGKQFINDFKKAMEE